MYKKKSEDQFFGVKFIRVIIYLLLIVPVITGLGEKAGQYQGRLHR